MARIDHFWEEGHGNAILTIEVNTVPGFSPASIFPKMLRSAGISIPETVNGMVAEMLQASR
jgi:D-alanine-D-alanine ligase